MATPLNNTTPVDIQNKDASSRKSDVKEKFALPQVQNISIQKWQESYQQVDSTKKADGDGEVDYEAMLQERLASKSDKTPTQSPLHLLSKKYDQDDSSVGGMLAHQQELPQMQNEQVVASANTPQMTQSDSNQDAIANLLHNFCSSVYMVNQPGFAAAGHVMLDVGKFLPGVMVELVREGAFLQVKLHANDPKTVQMLQRSRGQLVENLSSSTDLVVTVDAIGNNDSA